MTKPVTGVMGFLYGIVRRPPSSLTSGITKVVPEVRYP